TIYQNALSQNAQSRSQMTFYETIKFERYQQGAMKSFKDKVSESVSFIQTHIHAFPQVGFLTGTRLGESVAFFEAAKTFWYHEIPHFPISTVESHPGRLSFGNSEGIDIIAMQGRFHLYEGYSPFEVTFPVRVMQELGVKILILSNAAGGLNPEFQAGDIMLITDHINLTGSNPLIGPNEKTWGIRFPDMGQAYNKDLLKIADSIGRKIGICLQKGVYVGLKGPSLETPAEVRFLRTIGGEAVGFSTVHEVISAVHAGMRVLGLSVITNINDPDRPLPVTVDKVVAVSKKISPILTTILKKIMEAIHDH
ncbi:MAG: purine-nucleoside phosphorylase, partial [Desulfobacterales bacterium]